LLAIRLGGRLGRRTPRHGRLSDRQLMDAFHQRIQAAAVFPQRWIDNGGANTEWLPYKT
jgi:hypothetical protein